MSQLSFHNPLEYGSDPFAMLADDGYYCILCSGWKFYSSTDLIHLEDLGTAYEPKETDWFYGEASAPEIYHFFDKYWIFHTTEAKDNPYNEKENRKIGVLVSERPEGPYHDYLGRPLFDPGYCTIDIHVYSEGGKFYLYWAHSCYHHPVGMDDLEESWIYGAELKPDFSGIIGEPQLCVRPCQEWENHTIPLHQRRWNEGPFVLKHGDTYYLTFSGNTFEDYGVGYATAKHPLGPWKKAEENPILHDVPEEGIYAPGHNSFVTSKDGSELFIVYHMITDKPFNDPHIPLKGNVSSDYLQYYSKANDEKKGDVSLSLPKDGYALQHWPGYSMEYMKFVPVKDNARKIAINRVHFDENGRLVIDGPTTSSQVFPSGNE